jgi:hypothetical protein
MSTQPAAVVARTVAVEATFKAHQRAPAMADVIEVNASGTQLKPIAAETPVKPIPSAGFVLWPMSPSLLKMHVLTALANGLMVVPTTTMSAPS